MRSHIFDHDSCTFDFILLQSNMEVTSKGVSAIKNILHISLLQYTGAIDLHLLDRGYHNIPLTHKTYNTTEILTAGDIYSRRGNSFSIFYGVINLHTQCWILLISFPILILDIVRDLLVITTLLDLMLKNRYVWLLKKY